MIALSAVDLSYSGIKLWDYFGVSPPQQNLNKKTDRRDYSILLLYYILLYYFTMLTMLVKYLILSFPHYYVQKLATLLDLPSVPEHW